jgi:competence protein ComEC
MVVRTYRYIIQLLILVAVGVILAISQLPDGNLHIIACDVGQGDAILVTYKNIQILTDGGPDQEVLNCLGRNIPFWDRNIELIISSHPDSDHSTGLVDVIKRYNVDKILINPIDPGTDIYRLLESVVGGRGVGVVNPEEGMVLGLDLIHLDIVLPSVKLLDSLTVKNNEDKLAKYSIGKDTNSYSIVYKLSFKKFSGLFPGDITKEMSDSLSNLPAVQGVNYIKIPHHGSANGLTFNLLKATMPKVAVISVGSKNQWGFPAPSILQMLSDYNVTVLRTDKMGDAEVVTDGEKIWWKK